MPEFLAAIGLAQLERIEELIKLRKQSAQLFIDVMNDTDLLIPQKIPNESTNSYYTLGAIYNGEEKYGITWKDFRKLYINNGGDGIYGAWSVPYLEPAIKKKRFVKRHSVYKNVVYNSELCPIAENIQRKLMQFKTNYRNLDLAKSKAKILKKTIDNIYNS